MNLKLFLTEVQCGPRTWLWKDIRSTIMHWKQNDLEQWSILHLALILFYDEEENIFGQGFPKENTDSLNAKNDGCRHQFTPTHSHKLLRCNEWCPQCLKMCCVSFLSVQSMYSFLFMYLCVYFFLFIFYIPSKISSIWSISSIRRTL